MTSWVIIELSTDKALFETWNPKLVHALNTEKYKAVPILKYLGDLNRKIRENENQNIRTKAS